MATWELVVLIVFGALALLALGGALAGARLRRARDARLHRELDEVDRALAAARAQDRGWERSTIESAARRALADQRPGAEVRELVLVQVLDRPGTDEDRAVLRCSTDAGELRVTLGRRAGDWVAESLE